MLPGYSNVVNIPEPTGWYWLALVGENVALNVGVWWFTKKLERHDVPERAGDEGTAGRSATP